MLIDLLLGAVAGVALGIITGLTPGLHVNLVTAIAASFGLGLLSPYAAASFIVALMVSHNIFDFIPSVFLGAPDEGDALAVLPGHQLLLQGRGIEAVLYSSLGMAASLLLLSAAFFPVLYLLPFLYGLVQPFLAFALLGVMGVMILREKGRYHRVLALLLVLLSGCLGVAAFSFGLRDPLLPLLSGMFGLSVLLGNFSSDAKIHPQVLDLPPVAIKAATAPISLGTAAGCLLNLLPGVGPSQASMLALSFLKLRRPELVIATTAAVSCGSLFGSLIALLAINKARNAPLAQLAEIVTPTLELLISLFLVGIIATLVCSVLVLSLAPHILKVIARTPYGLITGGIVCLVLVLVFFRTGLIGLAILALSCSIGLACHHAGVGKHHLMASLLLPTVGYFVF